MASAATVGSIGTAVGLLALGYGLHLLRTGTTRAGRTALKLALAVFFGSLLVLVFSAAQNRQPLDLEVMILGSVAVIGATISTITLVNARIGDEPLRWYVARAGYYLGLFVLIIGLRVGWDVPWPRAFLVIGVPGLGVYLVLARLFRDRYYD